VAQEGKQIGTEQRHSSGLSEGAQFSVVEQTVGASKYVSSQESGLQATSNEAQHLPCRASIAKRRAHTNWVSKNLQTIAIVDGPPRKWAYLAFVRAESVAAFESTESVHHF